MRHLIEMDILLQKFFEKMVYMKVFYYFQLLIKNLMMLTHASLNV